MALDLCSMYPDRIDLASRNDWQLEVIRSLLQSVGQLTTGTESVDRLIFLPSLLTQELPLLDLSVEDAVAIRKDGIFDTWRHGVELWLDRIGTVDETQLLDPAGATRRELSEAMADAQNQLRQSIGKSAVLKQRQVGVMGFAISCVAGGLGAIGGPITGVLVGGAAFGASAVIRWLGGRPTSGERAFRRLVVQLTESG